jgi:hypothetical protein
MVCAIRFLLVPIFPLATAIYRYIENPSCSLTEIEIATHSVVSCSLGADHPTKLREIARFVIACVCTGEELE